MPRIRCFADMRALLNVMEGLQERGTSAYDFPSITFTHLYDFIFSIQFLTPLS